MKKSRLIRNDIILAISLAALSLGIYFLAANLNKSGGETLSVLLDGTEITSLSLSSDGVYSIGETGFEIEISDGAATVCKTDCSDRVCCGMKIDKKGGEIICLPNKIIVRHANKKIPAADVVAG